MLSPLATSKRGCRYGPSCPRHGSTSPCSGRRFRSFYGEDSPQLEQFGLKPKKKPAPLTAEQQAVRAAKARATRKLRSTKGPVQKALVKSGPMQVTVSPVDGPAASAASPPAVTGAGK